MELTFKIGPVGENTNIVTLKHLPFNTSQQAVQCARKNKLLPLHLRAFGKAANAPDIACDIPSELKSVAESNSRILQLIRVAGESLTQSGIQHIFYKGPIQQKILYGDFFAKPAVDADILVSRSDFTRARGVLADSGYRLAQGCAGIWWWHFLGEQHLFHEDNHVNSIDLHHRLQQPGSPEPRQMKRFLSERSSVQLGNAAISAPSLPHIALIAAMNLVKAIYCREVAGSHTLDTLTALKHMTPQELASTRAESRRQGLYKTMRFAARAASLLFDEPDLFSQEVVDMPFDAADLARLLFRPEGTDFTYPRRRVMLALLADNIVYDLPVEGMKWVQSETARLLSERDHRA